MVISAAQSHLRGHLFPINVVLFDYQGFCHFRQAVRATSRARNLLPELRAPHNTELPRPRLVLGQQRMLTFVGVPEAPAA